MTAWDSGVANERTTLAWQRTALAGFAGATIVMRLSWEETGLVSLVPVGVSALALVWLFGESVTRYRHAAGARRRDGIVPLLLASVVTLTCLLQVSALLSTD